MAYSKVVIVASGLIVAVVYYWLFLSGGGKVKSKDDVLSGIKVLSELEKTSRLLPDTPAVIKVVEGVYVAVGFSTGNSILLEGSEEVIIVDTAESVEAAKEMLIAFRKLTKKPVKAIIYTHHHVDHVAGAPAFIEDPKKPPEIWAHQSLKSTILNGMPVGPKAYRGIVHQFGLQLEHHLVSCFKLKIDTTRPSLPLFPTRFIENEETIQIPGLQVNLLHLPGETSDQVGIWLPEKRVLLAGDNIYSCFPNLYAIRGIPPRSSIAWAEAVRKMRSMNPEYLVLGHGLPISGAREIRDLLTVYMLGIRYVHDQTVRLINRGLHPDEIAKQIQLPSTLASHPYLRECYGMVGWSAKGVYEEYIGWFSGDPVELQPLTPHGRAERMMRLVGERKLLVEAKEALEREEFQWALEVSSMILSVDSANREAKDIRLSALRGLAGEQINPAARNFYMTAALDDHGLIDWKVDQTSVIEKLEMPVLMNLLRFKLKAEAVDGVNLTVVIHFKDTEEDYRLQILHSVLEVELLEKSFSSGRGDEVEENGLEGFNVRVITTSKVWREIASKKRSPLMAVATGDFVVEGGLTKLREFFSYFQE